MVSSIFTFLHCSGLYLIDPLTKKKNMNRLSLAIFLVCLSFVLINNKADAFFKAGRRSLPERDMAREENAMGGEIGAADGKELWEEFLKARNAERKRSMHRQ